MASHANFHGARPATYFVKEIQRHRIHLSEHHIYGSSRLGMQKYLPDDVSYDYALGDSSGFSVENLTGVRPWYSRYGEDIFSSSTLGIDELTSSQIGSEALGLRSHLLGLRHYELTNHLGNVQATVLDRVSPILHSSGTVLGYNAEISTAQDHFPFGMLMPGRYIADTGRHCILKSTTVLVPYYVREVVSSDEIVEAWTYGPGQPLYPNSLMMAPGAPLEPLHLFHMNDASTHPNGEVVTSLLQDSAMVYEISLSGEPSGGVIGYQLLHPDTNQTQLSFELNLQLPEDVYAELRVRQYEDSILEVYVDALPWTTIGATGTREFMMPVNAGAVRSGGRTVLELVYKTTHSGNFSTYNEANPWA